MAQNQIFLFPGFYSSEIDLAPTAETPVGVPAGIVGSSEKGPAFVPYTVGSFSDFTSKFGGLNSKFPSTYAAQKFLENRNALTFVRVLGAGANQTAADISATETKGTVKNAGFALSGSVVSDGRHRGVVQFIAAKHELTSNEAFGMPMFTNNDSYLPPGAPSDEVFLVRGAVLCAHDTRMMILDHNGSWSGAADDFATANPTAKTFKLVLSSSLGLDFGNDDGFAGIKIFTASLDPSSDNYFARLLNTDPSKFGEARHLVYGDFAVDAEVASTSTDTDSVCILSGSSVTSTTSGDTALQFRDAFGKFNTRYKTATTPVFISQPYGNAEYDLFTIKAIDDGEFGNTNVKISITNLVASTNPRYQYGSFTLLVRRFEDSDLNPEILEQFTECNLDPTSDKYVARVVGDLSAFFNFDVVDEEDRRVVRRGTYPNRSRYIRIEMASQVEEGKIPKTALPFGFRGPKLLLTNTLLQDSGTFPAFDSTKRLAATGVADSRLQASIVPPIPFRFKQTRGAVSTTPGLIGAPGSSEIADSRLFWGIKFERNNNDPLNTNVNGELNSIISSFTKFPGIEKLDIPVTGAYTDTFNNNKFTLARVALENTSFTDITASANTHMKGAAYIRNGQPDGTTYKILDGATERLTFASLVHSGAQPILFNKFSEFAKFTVCMFGGFDGTNILDPDAALLNDRSTSTETRGTVRGGSNASFTSPGFQQNLNGVGVQNNLINSYRVGVNIITNPITSNVNLLSVPGQREPFITNYTAEKTLDYGLALYLMDIPAYNASGDRIFDNEQGSSEVYVDVENSANEFETRALDNTAAAAYFPDITITDDNTGRKVSLPASVAALSAIGYNDKVAYPWFAPAGFNRAALNFVNATKTRLRQADKERLYQIRVNPIFRLPGEGYVIFSQKTLDAAQTALDSINVQRMITDVQRQVSQIGNRLIFEQLTPDLYVNFTSSVSTLLASVQNRGGLARFRVVCDRTNNSELDVENNRMNAKIFLLPVRAVEFIQLDFIITRAGVDFSVL